MPTDGSRLLAGYRAIDAQLVAAGRHPTSPAWMATLERFWLSGKTRLVVRKGRQGGGSTTMARVAVATALFGEHRPSPGTRLSFPFISVKLDDARERLFNIEDTLTVLGVRYTRKTEVIELEELPYYFPALACSMRANVGSTAGSAWEDEVSRWWSDEANANPAVDVDASLVPALVTQPNARVYTISSPLGLEDYHAQLIERGETTDQCVAAGPSWFWNPAITEEKTHALQPDERRWRREFLAEPQAGALSAFDADQVQRALGAKVPPGYRRCKPVVLLDPTAGGADSYAWAIAAWHLPPEREEGAPRLVFEEIDGIAQAAKHGITSDALVRHVVSRGRARGADTIHSDQFERFALSSAIGRTGFGFVPHVWTAPTKERSVEHVRGWLRDSVLVLPNHDKLKRELLNFEEKIAPSGALTFRGRRGGHDDHVALLLLGAYVDFEGGFSGSPLFDVRRARRARQDESYAAMFATLGYDDVGVDLAEWNIAPRSPQWAEVQRRIFENPGLSIEEAVKGPRGLRLEENKRVHELPSDHPDYRPTPGALSNKQKQEWDAYLKRGDKVPR